MKVWVVGNCQSRGTAKSVASLAGLETAVLDVKDVRSASDEQFAGMMAQVDRRDDVIFCQDVDGTHGRMSAEVLRAEGYRVGIYPLVAFAGFHPDCTYITIGETVVQSPLSDLNSSLIAAAYLEGVQPRRVPALFNAFSYASLGYFDQFDTGMRALRRRTDALGHDYEDIFAGGLSAPFMHTVNHPRIELLFRSALQTLRQLGIASDAGADMPDDEFRRSVVWPVYPEIARRCGIGGGLVFTNRGNVDVTLPELVRGSYELYQRQSLIDGSYFSPAVDRAREFIRQNLIVSAA